MKITIKTKEWAVTSTVTTLEDLRMLVSMAEQYQTQYGQTDEDVKVGD